MPKPVDLTNLRSMTDGDPEMEAVLFEEFNRSFVESIAVLEKSLAPEQMQEWRTKAHALKGISLNLGAGALSQLCKQAQEQFEVGAAEKQALLEMLRKEYAKVREYLTGVN